VDATQVKTAPALARPHFGGGRATASPTASPGKNDAGILRGCAVVVGAALVVGAAPKERSTLYQLARAEAG